MTTYCLPQEIYEKELQEKLESLPDLVSVFEEIREVRRAARLEREEARKPGFQPLIVSYIPAYGSDAQLRAMIDYCKLKIAIDRSQFLAHFIGNKILCPLRRKCRSENESALTVRMLSKDP